MYREYNLSDTETWSRTSSFSIPWIKLWFKYLKLIRSSGDEERQTNPIGLTVEEKLQMYCSSDDNNDPIIKKIIWPQCSVHVKALEYSLKYWIQLQLEVSKCFNFLFINISVKIIENLSSINFIGIIIELNIKFSKCPLYVLIMSISSCNRVYSLIEWAKMSQTIVFWCPFIESINFPMDFDIYSQIGCHYSFIRRCESKFE